MMGWIFLFLSIIFNIIAIWYVRELLQRFRYVQETSQNAYVSIEEYLEHLQKVYDLETYYGDSTLSGLLTHSRDLKEELDIYKTLFSLEDVIETEKENTDDS